MSDAILNVPIPENEPVLGYAPNSPEKAELKAALKDPGITPERMIGLLEEAKEISALLRGIGQRSEFDDELPASTFKPKPPPWKKWRGS